MGDRSGYLKAGVKSLADGTGIKIVATSDVFESEPADGSAQRRFFNLVVEVDTLLGPKKLLSACHRVENLLKRKRKVRWGPRVIDVDILLYDDVKMADDVLTIPHPHLMDRLFFLVPLGEIAPGCRLPCGQSAGIYGDGERLEGLTRVGSLNLASGVG